ncbi:hypothetical protein CA54_36910 [Symmachiella macrocystis]|uniref:Uncharacterized protein n=1 Tax=Symmachiella macrocystis TaxID=2527985 RepID=A0A5C6BSU3_9PLAN|nr:hypothetical protein [Symmachiella macrocystis]TWU14822.1 hypothetical protein CA54_36910 [Symmachiella macrocystis]
MALMNGPRFADTDFLAPDETLLLAPEETTETDPETPLDISERGVELLQKINEIIDLATENQPEGSDQPIIVQFTQK